MTRKWIALLVGLVAACVAAWADEPFRNHRYDSFKVLAPAEGSIVFIGNSITDMNCWPEVFKDAEGNYLPIVNRGNSGGMSPEQSANLEAYLGNKPAKVFMMIGTNDIGGAGLNAEAPQVLNYVRSIVTRIHDRYPSTEVYIYSILPSGLRDARRITECNTAFKNYVDGVNENWLTYVDLHSKLTGIPSDNSLSYDRLHCTAAAYKIWAETICPHLGNGVTHVYPENTAAIQVNGGLSGSNGMRATYASVMPVSSEDVLVFGDEMVKCGEWQELLGSTHIKNRGNGWGYGGDIAGTGKLVDANYADVAGVTKQDAKAIFLYTGTADANGNTDIETVKSSYKALVEKIKTKSPGSKLYLMSLCPVTNATTNTNRVSVLNAYMKSIADESADDNVKYVDVYTALAANGVANSKYFYPGNYLGGLGYVKVAQIMKEALDADFPGNDYEVISETEAETRKAQANLRCTLSQTIAAGQLTTVGEGVGEYNAALMAQFFEEVKTATAMLAKASLTKDEVNAEVAKLNGLILPALNMPKASTAGETHWYKFSTPARGNRYMASNGAGQAVTGEESNNYARSMWKLEERTDGSFNIINRSDNTYLSPASDYNTAIKTVAAAPAAGWTFSYSNAAGTYIISSGNVQLNQTQAAQNYQVYNWSSGGNGQDREDTGCRYAIVEVTEDPAEEPSSEPVVMLQDITLDGTAPYKFTDEEAAKVFALENLTVAIDFTYTEATGNQMLMSSSNSATTELMAIGTTANAVRTYTPNKDAVYTRGNVTFGTNRHKVVVTMRKDAGYTYYIDGANAGDVPFAAPVFGTVTGVDGLYLGGSVTSEGSNILPAKATIHSVRVFNYSLTAEEVAALTYGDEEEVTEMTYTIDKANGDLYRNGQVDATSWCSVWKSNATPQLQFATTNGVNNMKWYGNNLGLATGGSTHTFTLTPPAGYVIEEYSFSFVNENHANAITISISDDNKTYTSSSTAQNVAKTKQSLSSLAITLTGANSPVKFTDFTVKIKKDAPEKPVISTEGDEHWYYITSAAANKDYCRGKVMYYNAEDQKMHFGDKQFQADHIWSFWQNAQGKIAIKNYNGQYFGTAPGGTGGNTTFGVVDTPNYIYNINDAFGFFVIKDNQTEFHAQQAGSVIVRWTAEEGGASLWKFDEVDVSEPEAKLSATRVEQGKVTTGIGNKDQAIIRSTLTITGLTESCEFQGVKGTFAGTKAADVTKVKAYFATNSLELNVDADGKTPWRDRNAELFGEGTLNADNTFTITGTKALTPGTHYLWIAYDIADDAAEGNTVDAAITGYTIDGNNVEEENGNPEFAVTVFLSEGAVLMPMDMGSQKYRIPSITTTKDGKRLVVLTDDRKNHGADLPSHCYVVAQYSDDEGRSWSRPMTVAGTAETGGDYGHGDASLVTDRLSGRIVGIMTSSGTYGHGFFGGTAQEPPRWKTIISEDGGETWSTPKDHTDDLYGANCPNEKTQTWKSGFSGSGAALQMRDGTLVSSFVNREADNSQNFYFFMSDDFGDSWYVSGNSGTTAADEPKTLERNNGDLAISVRASGYNFHNVTSDRGETWKYAPQTRFTSGIYGNACDGEYMVWCSTVEGNPWDIALQTIPFNSARRNVSIALSTDEGETFGTPKTICPRGSCYSAVTVLPDGTLGVYYEEDACDTEGFDAFTMRFVRFSLDWASNGAYKFTEDKPFHPIALDKTVGVSDIISAPSQASDGIYDLSGRRVSKPAAGVYIRDGKKFIRK